MTSSCSVTLSETNKLSSVVMELLKGYACPVYIVMERIQQQHLSIGKRSRLSISCPSTKLGRRVGTSTEILGRPVASTSGCS